MQVRLLKNNFLRLNENNPLKNGVKRRASAQALSFIEIAFATRSLSKCREGDDIVALTDILKENISSRQMQRLFRYFGAELQNSRTYQGTSYRFF